MTEAKREKAGGMWQNTDKNGKPYFNLEVKGVKYVAFGNSYKSEDKQPDWIIYEKTLGNKTTAK